MNHKVLHACSLVRRLLERLLFLHGGVLGSDLPVQLSPDRFAFYLCQAQSSSHQSPSLRDLMAVLNFRWLLLPLTPLLISSGPSLPLSQSVSPVHPPWLTA